MSSFKAFDKRKKTLLVEYKNQFKANRFSDKRIGENDANLSLEDKMFKRFVVERKKSKSIKKSKFNLNDDDEDERMDGASVELTHFGQSLSQIENFERLESDDDDKANFDPDDVDKGKISAKIVSENFFGGFDKKQDSASVKESETQKKNRKEWVDEMIVKSKQLKYERQKERDKTLDLTELLDKEWKQIQPVVNAMVKKNRIEEDKQKEEEFANPPKADEYDTLVRSLQFDPKAKATDKVKSVEEIEKERLETLKMEEKAALERMNAEIPEDKELDDEKKAGVSIGSVVAPGRRRVPANHRSADDMDFDDDAYTMQRNRETIRVRQQKEIEAANAETKQAKTKKQEEDEKEESEEESPVITKSQKKEDEFVNDQWLANFNIACAKVLKGSIQVTQFAKYVESVLLKLDPLTDERNKQRLVVVTERLIQFYRSLFGATQKTANGELVHTCIRFVHRLTRKFGAKSTKTDTSSYIAFFVDFITQASAAHEKTSNSQRKLPNLDELMMFKLIAAVFPTSDFRHQITTPSLLIMTRYLTQCPVQTFAECFRGTFLCHLCFEFIYKSKRYIPECIQYLSGVLYLSVDRKDQATRSSFKPFELSTIYEAFKRTQLTLFVDKKTDKLNELNLLEASHFETNKVDDSKKISLIAYTIDVLSAFAHNYAAQLCFKEIFAFVANLLKLLPNANYPIDLQEKIEKLQEFITESSNKSREHLKCLSKKPIPNKLLEPKLQVKSKHDSRPHNSVISEKQLNAIKYKKEYKSAIKEIRQDNQFIARVQLQEQMAKDAKRAAKVREIMGGLSMQEGEYQKAKRLKDN